MRRFRLVLLVTIAAALSARVGAAGEGDSLITDPALLTRLGFSPDARNVYLAKGAVLDQKSSPAEPDEFGTTDSGWTTVIGTQHHPVSGNTVYDTDQGIGDIHWISGPVFFEAQLQMPSGALWQQVVWFGRDDDPGPDLLGVVYRVCQTGIADPTSTVLGSSTSSDGGNFVFNVSIPAGEVVRNQTCAYFASTGFGSADLRLRKVRAQWRRQVSPAPTTATFPLDTPTTHPFFRFIEAVADAGITAGCAPQSFCPDAPVTRGQMAVFLAVALGLHFPN